MDELGVSGLAFLGDLVMIKGCPIIKIITSSFNVPVSILGVKYCPKHLAQGGNKDVTFISNSFKPYFEQYDEKKSRMYLVFFDDESNVQKAGQILAVYYPRITLLHNAEHVLSIFSLAL